MRSAQETQEEAGELARSTCRQEGQVQGLAQQAWVAPSMPERRGEERRQGGAEMTLKSQAQRNGLANREGAIRAPRRPQGSLRVLVPPCLANSQTRRLKTAMLLTCE